MCRGSRSAWPRNDYESRSLRLEPGDRLYLYSDGITEAMNPADVLFGAERMLSGLLRGRSEPLATSVSNLLADVRSWGGAGLRDDISLVAVEFGPAVEHRRRTRGIGTEDRSRVRRSPGSGPYGGGAMNWTLERKLTVGFAIILGILLINALIAASCIRNLASNGRWVLHSHFVLSEIDELESGLKDAGFGVLGYVLTSRQGFLDRDRQGMEQVAHRLANLRRLTRDNPVQQAEVARIEQAVKHWLAVLQETIRLRDEKGMEVAASGSWRGGTGRCGSTSGTSSMRSRKQKNSCSDSEWRRPARASGGASPASPPQWRWHWRS